MKKSIKILSVFLAVLTFFGILSVATPVFAADVNEYIADKEYTEKLLTEVVENDTEEKAPIVEEVEEKRDEYQKVYLREDGTYTAVISKTPVHYEKDGEWVDIVNDLKTDGDVLTNTAGNFNVEFPKEISEDNEIKIENGKESLTFSIVETEKSNGKVKNNKKQKQDKSKVSDEEIFNNDISRTVSEIEYEDVLENTNLEYVVTPTGVKENIIVENKESLKKSYSFNITKGDLKAELDKENNLYFKNSKGEVVFTIPAPVMTDSNGAISYDIDVKVKNLKKETITLTYTPDKKWLNDKDRAYPIAIDPVIILESNKEEFIQDTVIAVDSTDSTVAGKTGNNDFIGAVTYTDEVKRDILVKLNMDVFSAFNQSNIVITDVNYVAVGNVLNGNILAKEIVGTWNTNSITGEMVYPSLAGEPGNATVTYKDEIIDYFSGATPQASVDTEAMYIDITTVFLKWLNNPNTNNGFALTAQSKGLGSLLILGGVYKEGTADETYYSSYCTVDYIEANGYNSNFEYLTQSIGRAGTFNVNVFTRENSAYREDVSMSGSNMPVTVGFNYNSAYLSYYEFLRNYSATLGENVTVKSPYGENWTPSNLCALMTFDGTEYYYFTETGSMATFYITEDDEGNTIFTESENSEIGYELALINSSKGTSFTNLVITNLNGEKVYFNSDGLPVRIEDGESSVNKITIEYEDQTTTTEGVFVLPKIGLITDGAGRKYDFIYTNDKLIAIECLASNGEPIEVVTDEPLTISYNINSSNQLTTVTYQDNNSISYTYDSSGNLINAKNNIDGYNIDYAYDSLGKVTNIAEYANEAKTVSGNYITLTQESTNYTVVADKYNGTNTYLFTKNGEVAYTLDDKGNYYKNSTFDYSLDEEATEDIVVTDNSWEIISRNLLRNSSFETEYSSLNTTRAKDWNDFFTRTSAVAHTGAYAYLVTTDKTDEIFNQQKIDVVPESYYTFSAFVKKTSATGKLTLKIDELNENNEIINTEKVYVTQTTDWERFSVTVETSENTKAIYVSFGFEEDNSNTSCYIDTLQLERGLGVAPYNYVENNSFIYTLDDWTTNDTGLSVVSETINNQTIKALSLPQCLPSFDVVSNEEAYFVNETSSATQTINITAEKGAVISIGGWFKGCFSDGVLSESAKANLEVEYVPQNIRTAQVKASYTYTDTSGATVEESFAVDFLPGVNGWQFATDSFVLKENVTSIDVTVIATNLPQASLFTNVILTKDEDATVISLDETEMAEPDLDDSTAGCKCEDCEELDCTCTCEDVTACTCVPCTRRSNIETTSSDGKTVTTQMFNGSQYMQSAITYSDDLNNVVSETDENNISTAYAYNTAGAVTSITDGTNSATSYQNDAMGYLKLAQTSVTGLSDNESNISLEFTYNKDLLSTATADDVVYSYTYDDWGQTKSVSVDNQKLVEYNYGTEEKRSRVTYIESQIDSDRSFTLDYIYDGYGNIVQVVKTIKDGLSRDENSYYYHYDNLGTLLYIKDSVTGRTIHYSEDGGVTIEVTGADEPLYISDYNENGEFTETINGVTYTTKSYDSSYSASSGETTEKEVITSGTNKNLGVATVSDWFGRNKTVTVSTNDPMVTATANDTVIVSGYTYATYDTNKTTNLIKTNRNSITSPNGTKIATFSYGYDSAGRIVTKNTSSNITGLAENNSYTYDEAGQLVRENKSTKNTWVYAYDANGNITSRKAYNYTVAGSTPTALVSTDTFTYATGTWEDRLVSYNGQSIVYDNIGNPTTYLGATLTWRGRELANYTKGTTSIDYSYDVDSMRYQKLVKTNGSETSRYNYVYADGQLILLSYTANSVTQNAKFIYDSAGEVRGFVVDGATEYLYVKNPQGDIVAVISETGVPVVRYTYDAWGNATITTDTGYEALVNLSPFAYRGYCYDNDIKMYYLQSRYYDPQICSFINADSSEYLGATGTVLSCNLFAYCENDPVDFVDPKGTRLVGQCIDVGCVSADVKIIQDRLCNLGYNLKIDGIYGPKTKAVIKAFQKKNKKSVRYVDGIVGDLTWKALFKRNAHYLYNCYSYAMGINSMWLIPGDGIVDFINTGKSNLTDENYTVSDIRSLVVRDFGRTYVRKLNDKNSKLKSNEYLVAIRVCTDKHGESIDFHFMKKDPNTGKWWHKQGDQPIECLGKIDPDKKTNWVRKNDWVDRYYNSKTLYIAVRRTFWSKTFK